MVRSRRPEWDAIVAGGGVAGLSAAAILARAGLRVACIDPEPPRRVRVGESLDWSAPALLADLGLAAEDVICTGVGTPKREIRAATSRPDLLVGRPRPWVERWPLRFESSTLHVDRERFDPLLQQIALNAGAVCLADRVSHIDFDGDRVIGFVTASGSRLTGSWYIDASGRRRLIQRTAGIETQTWGNPRIALWSQVEAPMSFEGTMIHLHDVSDELSWAWEIPVSEDRQSVGVVIALSRFRALRRLGRSAAEIFRDEVGRFPALITRLSSAPQTVHTRSYHPFVSSRVTGANWLCLGEAAAMVDPLTSAGVTLALRHASEAAKVILDSVESPGRTGEQLRKYDRRLRTVSSLYNYAIENLMYDPTVRRAVGVRWASRAYVTLGYGTNSLYSRLRATQTPGSISFALIVRAMRLWANAWLRLSMLVLLCRQPGDRAVVRAGRVPDAV